MVRTFLSAALGIAIWALIKWASEQQPQSVTLVSPFWNDFERVVGSSVRWLFFSITPGLLVGLTASKRPVLVGGLVASACSLLDRSRLFSIFPSDYYPTFVATLLGVAAVQFVYGAAGASLGVVLGRSNNSFKPTPLRGAA